MATGVLPCFFTVCPGVCAAAATGNATAATATGEPGDAPASPRIDAAQRAAWALAAGRRAASTATRRHDAAGDAPASTPRIRWGGIRAAYATTAAASAHDARRYGEKHAALAEQLGQARDGHATGTFVCERADFCY